MKLQEPIHIDDLPSYDDEGPIPSHAETEAKFRDEIRSYGLEPPEVIEPGKFHHFPGVGKRKGNTAGWCKLFNDGLGGCFGDWSTDLKEIWFVNSNAGKSASPGQIKLAQQEAARAKKKWQEEEAARHAQAATKAQAIWDQAEPALEWHPYLIRKRIQPHGARIYKNQLVLPVINFTGKLSSLQFISPNGNKRLLKGGRKQGCYIPVAGDPDNYSRIIICEGWATGCSLAEAEPSALVVAAIDAGNLEPVAIATRHAYPNTEIIIAGDDDRKTPGNPGYTKANEAAIASNAFVCFPKWPDGTPDHLTDFNDLAVYLAGGQNMNSSQQQHGTLTQNAEPPEWPELIPLNIPLFDPIDLNLLPWWARDFAVALAAHTETPPELAFGMVLGTCSAAVSRRCRVQVKPGYFEPCNLWLMVALASGNRKSSVQKAATAPLLDWEDDQAAALKDEITRKKIKDKNIDSRIRHLRAEYAKTKDESKRKEIEEEIIELEAEKPDIPIPPQIWTSDATPEALGRIIESDEGSIAWLSSEAGIFDQLLDGRYSKGNLNLDLLLKAHSGDADRVDRISRPGVTLKNPRITICLSPQVHMLEGLAAKPGFVGRGLLARFLPLIPKSPLGTRTLETANIPKEVQDKYKDGIYAMLNWPAPDPAQNGGSELYPLKLSESAYKRQLQEFAQKIEKEMGGLSEKDPYLAWLSKSQYGTLARIASVLHCTNLAFGNPWEKEITAETMSDAIDITVDVMNHARAAIDIMVADQEFVQAKTLADWIKRKNVRSFKTGRAQRDLRSVFPKKDMLDGPLKILEDRGYTKKSPPPKREQSAPGRPPDPLIMVNPKVFNPSPSIV